MIITSGNKSLQRRMMVKKVIDPILSLDERAKWLKWLNDFEFNNLSELRNEFTIELSLTLDGRPCEAKPIQAIFGCLNSNSGLSLVPYDLSANAPYVVIRKNYVNMGVVNNPFLAVPSVILTRPYKATGDLGRKVATL